MWHGQDKDRQDKVWMHYLHGIIASDVYSAVFLSSWMRNAVLTRSYTYSLEVIDLQKYKVVRRNPKVRISIHNRADVPFVFIVGKN